MAAVAGDAVAGNGEAEASRPAGVQKTRRDSVGSLFSDTDDDRHRTAKEEQHHRQHRHRQHHQHNHHHQQHQQDKPHHHQRQQHQQHQRHQQQETQLQQEQLQQQQLQQQQDQQVVRQKPQEQLQEEQARSQQQPSEACSSDTAKKTGEQKDSSLTQDERQELELLRQRYRKDVGFGKQHHSEDERPKSAMMSAQQPSAPEHTSQRSKSVTSLRLSTDDPCVLFDRLAQEIDTLDAQDFVPKPKPYGTPIPPQPLSFNALHLEELALAIHSGILGEGGGTFGNRLQALTKIEVQEMLKRAAKVLEKAAHAAHQRDIAKRDELVRKLKDRLWESIKRGEAQSYRQTSSMDDHAIACKFAELQAASAELDLDGIMFACLDDAVAKRVSSQEQERFVAMEADMQELANDLPKFKMLQYTMGFLVGSQQDLPFKTADPSILECKFCEVKLGGAKKGKSPIWQHRFIAFGAGTTTVTDPLTMRTWQVNVLPESEATREAELGRQIALTEAKRRAEWWGTRKAEDPLEVTSEEEETAKKSPRWGQARRRQSRDGRRRTRHRKDSIGGEFKPSEPRPKAAWRTPVRSLHKRQSVDEMDLFEIIAPLLKGRRTKDDIAAETTDEQEACTAQEEAWAVEALEHFLCSGRDPGIWRGPKTPLIVCVKHGRRDVVTLLLKARADPDETIQKRGGFGLAGEAGEHRASQKVSSGETVTKRGHRHGSLTGVSALHIATWEGYEDICRALLQYHADPNVVDLEGATPMFFAPNTRICKLLYSYGSKVDATNKKRQTALHYACRSGNEAVLTWMGKKLCRESIQQRDQFGATAAYYGLQAGLDAKRLVEVGVRLTS